MKTPILQLLTLMAGLGSMLPYRTTAQTFTTLRSFTGALYPHFTNSGGAYPDGRLILSGDTLYGTASDGGSSGWGVVFVVKTDGTGFTNLHQFAFSDGAMPHGGLILSSNTLYGTTSRGGNPGFGTVFAINTNGADFTNLHTFPPFSGPDYTNSDGAYAVARLVLSGNTLYGTAYWGGSSGNGTVFKVNTDGTGFTDLHSFAPPYVPPSGGNRTNSDGANPRAGLILSGNTLYGTAEYGGSSGYGTVFAINTDGTGFRNLHSFSGNDGAFPRAGLSLSGNTLYGTAAFGGSLDQGVVFAVKTDGTGFTNLHSFSGSDGANPEAGLSLSGNTLYGTAEFGGISGPFSFYGSGTVFAIHTDGTGFSTLHSFAALEDTLLPMNSDGAHPRVELIVSRNTLYGTTRTGGGAGGGTVFSLSFTPRMTIIPSGPDFVLFWPTNYAGFDYSKFTLQSAPTITGTFTNLPGATSPYTNPVSGAQQFFRLISN